MHVFGLIVTTVLSAASYALASPLPGGTGLSYCQPEGYPTKINAVSYSNKTDPPQLELSAVLPVGMARGFFTLAFFVEAEDGEILLEEDGEFCDYVSEPCPFAPGTNEMSFKLASSMLKHEAESLHASFTLFFKGQAVIFCFHGKLGHAEEDKLVLQEPHLDM